MSCTFVALALLAAGPAHAAGVLRHAVVIEERVTLEGAAAPLAPGAVEAALNEAMLAKGITLIDAEHTRALRRSIDPRAVVDGAGLGAITTQDTDVVVAGLVTGAITRPLGLNILGCSLTAQLRVVAVDSGEVVLATSAQVMERDFTSEQALFAAAKKLAASLADALAAKSSAERRLELQVALAQPADLRVIEQLTKAVENLEGVTSARVMHSDKELITLEIRTKGADARALALRLSEAPSSGLAVWGYSDRAVKAKLVLAKALGLRLVPIQLTASGRAKSDGEMLSRALAAGLAGAGLFEVDAGSELASPGEKARVLASLAKQPSETIVLSGAVSGVGDKRVVSASLVRARDKRSIADATAECGSGALTECMQDLAGRLAKSAAAALQTQDVSTFAARPGKVLGASIADVFPAPFSGRARVAEATDWVEVQNTGDAPIDELELSVSIPGISGAPIGSERRTLRPNEKAKIPVKLVLDPAKLAEHDKNETTALQIELSYRVGEFSVRDRVRRAVTVYHRNAMTWANADAVASFVTATSDPIERAARSAAQSIPAERRGDPLALAAALFSQLRSLAYVADPVNPYAVGTVDYVQFPAQTLSRGAGDCDDLAVLYAALLEAVGLEALLVTTPGHIFVAVPTHSPASSLASGIVDPARALMQHDGRLWIPVETSLVDRGFEAAWAKGASEVAAATKVKRLGVIDVRRAWLTHPPIDLSPSNERGPTLAPIDPQQLEASAAKASEKLKTELSLALDDVVAKLAKRPDDPELLNRQGVALVSLGKLSDAAAVFTKSAKLAAASPSATNNLGNIALMSGDAQTALDWYQEAAQIEVPSAATKRCILLNRLLAAWMQDAGGPRFLELVLAASDDDLKAFYQGVNGGPLRGGPSKPADGAQSAVRKDTQRPEGAPVPVARLVRWL